MLATQAAERTTEVNPGPEVNFLEWSTFSLFSSLIAVTVAHGVYCAKQNILCFSPYLLFSILFFSTFIRNNVFPVFTLSFYALSSDWTNSTFVCSSFNPVPRWSKHQTAICQVLWCYIWLWRNSYLIIDKRCCHPGINRILWVLEWDLWQESHGFVFIPELCMKWVRKIRGNFL